jgi:predicted Rossmann fold nucleotide-binding protein DprA/Smf involved in DNA uptake
MTVTVKTQAILLLTARFSKEGAGGDAAGAKPLTPKEWGRFAEWLNAQSLTPERLLNGRLAELLSGWRDKTVTAERLAALLERGPALALSMEKWQRAGLWVMTRGDADYPRHLKQRLGADSPAVLFGCGNRALLSGGGLAVIGSRDASEADLAYSRELGALAARAGHSIVSGGAKGVDQAAMSGALEVEGTAVGVLADSLLRACTSARYRRYLVENNLVLVSPFNPEAGFNVGNAMQRNKYIYCLADGALVVHSGTTGGTWNGALENLKKRWVPLWVKRTADAQAGNEALAREGAVWVADRVAEIDLPGLLVGEGHATAGEGIPDAGGGEGGAARVVPSRQSPGEPLPVMGSPPADENAGEADMANGSGTGGPGDLGALAGITFYELFLAKARPLCSEAPRTPEELTEALGLKKSQANDWLKQAVAEGRLQKVSKPVRYRWVAEEQAALPLDWIP